MSPRILLALLFASLSIGSILRGPVRPADLTATPSPSLVVDASELPASDAPIEPTATPSAEPSPLPTPDAPAPSGGYRSALEALAALTVASERRDGYDRDLFRHWVDTDRDGCDTRREVLIDESIYAVSIGVGCAISGGSWYSAYDAVETTDPVGFDIDHLVPLAEAWDSGAWAWDPSRREAYANDLGDPRSLIAVTARSNRSKADQDPSEWLPPLEAYRCRYASDWVAVKLRWSLAIDSFEQGALTAILRACPATPLTVSAAP
jgi:hypothetical protein